MLLEPKILCNTSIHNVHHLPISLPAPTMMPRDFSNIVILTGVHSQMILFTFPKSCLALWPSSTQSQWKSRWRWCTSCYFHYTWRGGHNLGCLHNGITTVHKVILGLKVEWTRCFTFMMCVLSSMMFSTNLSVISTIHVTFTTLEELCDLLCPRLQSDVLHASTAIHLYGSRDFCCPHDHRCSDWT